MYKATDGQEILRNSSKYDSSDNACFSFTDSPVLPIHLEATSKERACDKGGR